jgi:hypothetical protein
MIRALYLKTCSYGILDPSPSRPGTFILVSGADLLLLFCKLLKTPMA